MATMLELVPGSAATPRSDVPYRIVVGIDFSAPAMRAADLAMRVARRHPRSEVHLVGVSNGRDSAVPYECLATALVSLAEDLDDAARVHGKANAPVIVSHAFVASPSQAIVHVAQGLGARMIVLGTGAAHRFFSRSVTDAVRRIAPCAVVTVDPPTMTPPRGPS